MPSIILITIDALRADHLGCYGYGRNTSPFLDSLANKGTLFTNSFSNGSGTVASFPTLLSSDYLSTHQDRKYLSQNRLMIQELLKNNNFSTAAIHSNPYLSKYYGYERGFDFFYDSMENNSDCFLFKKFKEKKMIFKNLQKFLDKLPNSLARKIVSLFKNSKQPYVDATEINNMVIRWLTKNKDNNFFFWLHYMDVHEPYMPNSEVLSKFNEHIGPKKIDKLNDSLVKNKKIDGSDLQNMIDLYDAQISYLDNKISNLFGHLDRLNLVENSLIIITSDHGDEFKEHGGFSHLGKLYDEIIRVPLIILGRGFDKLRNETLVSLLDVSPSIVHWLGMGHIKEFKGRSFLKKNNEKPIICENTDTSRVCVRNKKYKLIYNVGSCNYEFYDLKNDPSEKINLYEVNENLKEVKNFKKLIANHLKIGEINEITNKIKI